MPRVDIDVQCTRCRNKHKESERAVKPHPSISGATQLVCPRCACTSFYDLTPFFAWCWASGLIEFGPEAPAAANDGNGCIVIATGPKNSLRAVVEVMARHGKGASEGQLLVPGVPEAGNQKAAADALATWLKWCAQSNGLKHRHGVEFLTAMEG